MATGDVTKYEIKRAIIPSMAMAYLSANVLGTPEPITLIFLTTTGFLAAMIVLHFFFRLAPVYSWPLWKQRLAIWGVAACSSALTCLAPLAMPR